LPIQVGKYIGVTGELSFDALEPRVCVHKLLFYFVFVFAHKASPHRGFLEAVNLTPANRVLQVLDWWKSGIAVDSVFA
jgi:hypothetical protein